MHKWEIGIDEVGRGPLAGPVGVGVVLVPADFDWVLIEGVNDSKKLTSDKREVIFRLAKRLKKAGKLDYVVSSVSASVIDKIGIVPAINLAMSRGIKKITANFPELKPKKVIIKLDGGLKAPKEYLHQETIIKGDSKEKSIGLASIVAKVTRDKYMEKLAKKPEFSAYIFEKHKGYGTKLHRKVISEKGLSSQHRVSFCKNIKNIK